MRDDDRRGFFLIVVLSVTLLPAAGSVPIIGQVSSVAYADEAKARIGVSLVGEYELTNFWDMEEHKCSGTVRFDPKGTCAFNLTIIPPEEGEDSFRVQLNGDYEIQKNVIKLYKIKRGPEDISYADPQDSDAFPDTFTFDISGKTMTLTSMKEEEEGKMKSIRFVFKKSR